MAGRQTLIWSTRRSGSLRQSRPGWGIRPLGNSHHSNWQALTVICRGRPERSPTRRGSNASEEQRFVPGRATALCGAYAGCVGAQVGDPGPGLGGGAVPAEVE